MERVSTAAGPVGLIKVRILPHVASPENGQGMARTRHKVLYHLHQRDTWVNALVKVMQSREQELFKW